MMRLLSSVIKAYQVSLTTSVYQVNCQSFLTERSCCAQVQSAEEQLAYRDGLLAEAIKRREEILAEAAREREALLEDARMDVLDMEAQARKKGYEAGYLEGLAEGRLEAGRLRHEAGELLQEAKRLRSELLGRVEPEVVRLSISVAEQLIGRQLVLAPETIVSVVAQALQEASAYSAVLVRVHPEDLSVCQAFSGEMQGVLREKASLDFIGDRALPKGDCLVETEGALIECRLGEQLSGLCEALAGVAGK